MTHRSLFPLLLCTMLLSSAACVSNDRAHDIVELEGDATRGKEFYDGACAGCHGADGKGGTFNVSVVFANRVKRDVGIADTILEGKDEMPPYDQWTDQQIADVIAYVNTL